jgi:hypothetical protein
VTNGPRQPPLDRSYVDQGTNAGGTDARRDRKRDGLVGAPVASDPGEHITLETESFPSNRGSSRPDAVPFEHERPESGTVQHRRDHEPGDPCADDDDFGP